MCDDDDWEVTEPAKRGPPRKNRHRQKNSLLHLVGWCDKTIPILVKISRKGIVV